MGLEGRNVTATDYLREEKQSLLEPVRSLTCRGAIIRPVSQAHHNDQKVQCMYEPLGVQKVLNKY